MEQARKTAQEHNKKRKEAEAAQAAKDDKKTIKNDEDDDDDDLIGPPLPPTITKGGETSATTTKVADLMSPPLPGLEKSEDGEKDEDSYDELSGSDDEELTLEKRIPNTHEVREICNNKI